MNNIIEVSGLEKAYGAVKAVRGIDFYVQEGSMFAFLGVNGAGKSTTIDILATILAPDAGYVSIDGHELGKEDGRIREKIGIVYQDSLLDPGLTVRENLTVRGSFYGLGRAALKSAVYAAAEMVGVHDLMKRRYGKLSGGQRRRVDIARALVNTPRVLFLDEPTTGLDPESRENLWAGLTALQKNMGLSIFATTHYMEEASRADYITIINDGRIVAKGTPSELKEAHSSDFMKIAPKDGAILAEYLQSKGLQYRTEAGLFIVPVESTLAAVDVIDAQRNNMLRFEVLMGTLDDVFINITKRERDE